MRDDALLMADEQGRVRWHGVLSDITEHKRAEAELQRRAAQQAAVARIGELALAGTNLTELMDAAVTDAAEILQTQHGAVLQLTRGGEWLLLRAGFGCLPETVDNLRVRVHESHPGRGDARHRAGVMVNDWDDRATLRALPVLNPPQGQSGLTVAIERRRRTVGRARGPIRGGA